VGVGGGGVMGCAAAHPMALFSVADLDLFEAFGVSLYVLFILIYQE